MVYNTNTSEPGRLNKTPHRESDLENMSCLGYEYLGIAPDSDELLGSLPYTPPEIRRIS
jgi:hypothetical protein